MHPLKTNMRLATAAAAQARGGILSQEEEAQLQYAAMLIDIILSYLHLVIFTENIFILYFLY